MSLQWTAVATFLYAEVFAVLLLCIPFISPKRYGLFPASKWQGPTGAELRASRVQSSRTLELGQTGTGKTCLRWGWQGCVRHQPSPQSCARTSYPVPFLCTLPSFWPSEWLRGEKTYLGFWV